MKRREFLKLCGVMPVLAYVPAFAGLADGAADDEITAPAVSFGLDEWIVAAMVATSSAQSGLAMLQQDGKTLLCLPVLAGGATHMDTTTRLAVPRAAGGGPLVLVSKVPCVATVLLAQAKDGVVLAGIDGLLSALAERRRYELLLSEAP